MYLYLLVIVEAKNQNKWRIEDKEKIITPASRRLVCSSCSQHHLCYLLQTTNAYGTICLEDGVHFYATFSWISFLHPLFLYTFIVFVCCILFSYLWWNILLQRIYSTHPYVFRRSGRMNSKKSLQIRNINNTSAKT